MRKTVSCLCLVFVFFFCSSVFVCAASSSAPASDPVDQPQAVGEEVAAAPTDPVDQTGEREEVAAAPADSVDQTGENEEAAPMRGAASPQPSQPSVSYVERRHDFYAAKAVRTQSISGFPTISYDDGLFLGLTLNNDGYVETYQDSGLTFGCFASFDGVYVCSTYDDASISISIDDEEGGYSYTAYLNESFDTGDVILYYTVIECDPASSFPFANDSDEIEEFMIQLGEILPYPDFPSDPDPDDPEEPEEPEEADVAAMLQQTNDLIVGLYVCLGVIAGAIIMQQLWRRL